MKKYIISFTIIFALLASCQKDDFCIDSTTPFLVVSFYDNDDQAEYNQPESLNVWADGRELIHTAVATDSILIPLDPNADFTLYHFQNDEINDTLVINYTREHVFVSRSCGYKYNFQILSLTGTTNNWIKSTEITNETVDNETEHIKILH